MTSTINRPLKITAVALAPHSITPIRSPVMAGNAPTAVARLDLSRGRDKKCRSRGSISWPHSRSGPLAEPTDLPVGLSRNYRVQPRPQKYFASRFGRNTFIDSVIPPDKGAYRDRHGRAAGCGGRGGVVCAIVDRRAGFP